jgi:phosphopantothenoylcysteine decarboxylase / phosphopantothenate---cysteine ligase
MSDLAGKFELDVLPRRNKKILLGICGGIAAYKCCELIRRLRDEGAQIRVVMTENAEHFVGKASFQALSGEVVRTDLWDEASEAAMGHIELARWADLLLIAPATTNTIAKLAHGLADNLLTTLALASKAPLAIAPAMNQQMFAHPATQANLAQLANRGVMIWGPAEGSQACGDVGKGRMLEASELLQAIQTHFAVQAHDLSALRGKHVLINAGPTYEDLDPVRFLGNRSSGLMGFAIAQIAAFAGAHVSLVAGPTAMRTPFGVTRMDVRDARSMHAQTMALIDQADIFIAAAAVADYRPASQSPQKIKKSADESQLALVKNPDIAADVSAYVRAKRKPILLVGFAAETENVLEYARAKRARKGLDFIAANQVGPGVGMEAKGNALVLIGQDSEIDLGYAEKTELAARLLAALAKQFRS